MFRFRNLEMWWSPFLLWFFTMVSILIPVSNQLLHSKSKNGYCKQESGSPFFNLISIGSNLQRHCDCPGHYHHQAILGCEVSGSQHTQGIAHAVQKCSRHSVISLYWWSTGKYILCSYLDYEWVKFRNVMYTICPVLVSWALITAHSSIPRWHEPSWDSTRSFQHVVPCGNTAVSFDQIAQGNKQPYIISAILMKRNGHWVWTVDFDASPQKRHKRSMIPPTSVSHDEVSAVVQTTGRTAPGASSVRSWDLNLRHLELGESPQLDCRLFWFFLYPFYCETWTSVSKIFLLQTTVSPKTNSQLAASSYKFEPSDMVREKGNWSVRMRYLDPCQAAAKENIDIYTQVMASRLSDWPKQQGLSDIPCFVPVGTHTFVPTLWVFREDQRFWGVNTAPSRTHPPDSGANQICSLKNAQHLLNVKQMTCQSASQRNEVIYRSTSVTGQLLLVFTTSYQPTSPSDKVTPSVAGSTTRCSTMDWTAAGAPTVSCTGGHSGSHSPGATAVTWQKQGDTEKIPHTHLSMISGERE